MASGKTTVGNEVARLLNLEFIDLDDYISNVFDESVAEIISGKGEIYFRKIEHQMLNEIIESKTDCVLALGGGTPCYADNRKIFNRENVLSFYLKASPKFLGERLKAARSNRPLVSNIGDENLEEFVAQHLFERSYFYMKAQNIVPIEGKSVDEISAIIVDYSRKKA